MANKTFSWNKVPSIGLLFWLAKLISTGMGESVSDASNSILKGIFGGNEYAGAILTLLWSGALFAIFLHQQRSAERYQPIAYWGAVAMLAIFGTCLADSTTAELGLPIFVLVLIATALLGLCFFFWHRATGNLSIHNIRSRKTEGWYWITVAVTFALGTLIGDWMADYSVLDLGMGYLNAGIFLAVIFAALLAYRAVMKPQDNSISEILTFWLAYVLTRPIGASFSDYFCYKWDGGILGNREMSGIFFILFAAALTALVLNFAKDRRQAKLLKAH
ncbi:MAG: hypothetical protein LBI43_02735 [Streptococcaceae bacterium]|jgi:uncharacterized membrane-anchored protein|nr:hypothetical protein [Streptococcaceae bacterium]